MTNFFFRLRRQQDGVAAVEFALLLPLLMLLFFGAVELSNLLIADAKLRNTASAVADLLTQKSNGTVSITDLNVANLAAAQIMLPNTVNGKLGIMFSTYRPQNINQARLLWTRIITGGAANPQLGMHLGMTTPPCNDTNLPDSLLPKSATSPFNDVLMVTAVYDWTPWFATIYDGTIRLRSTNYNMPRYTLTLNPGADVTPPC